MIVHLLTKQSGQDFTTGCGRGIKAASMPEDISGWTKDITCPLCATRLIVHKKLEDFESMGLLIDLDNEAVAYKFHFGGKRFRFRWLINQPLIYVYNGEEDVSPMLAFPIVDDEYTSENAAVAAKLWILEHGDGFAANGSLAMKTYGRAGTPSPSAPSRGRLKKMPPPPKPVIPEGYDGPLCAGCGKIDEGDFVNSPLNMLEMVCMTCLIVGTK